MWDLFDIFGGIIDVVGEFATCSAGWRLYLCIIAGAAIIASIYGAFENDRISLVLSIPVGIVALTTGLVWDHRNG